MELKNKEIETLWKLIEAKDFDVLSERLEDLKFNNDVITLKLKDLLKGFLLTIVNLSVVRKYNKSGECFINLPNDYHGMNVFHI